jgi:hypothetical protein
LLFLTGSERETGNQKRKAHEQLLEVEGSI